MQQDQVDDVSLEYASIRGNDSETEKYKFLVCEVSKHGVNIFTNKADKMCFLNELIWSINHDTINETSN